MGPIPPHAPELTFSQVPIIPIQYDSFIELVVTGFDGKALKSAVRATIPAEDPSIKIEDAFIYTFERAF